MRKHFRNAQGNVLGVYNRTTAATPTITWAEQHIYGSGRLGSFNPGIAWNSTSTYTGPHYATTRRLLQGQKRYELSNHLGNVLVTIGDRRIPRDGTIVDNTAEFYDATVLSANDYYPFGMEMPGRTFAVSSGYRYGFNGKEKDPTEFGALTHYDYGFRIYNPAIAKFLSVDKLSDHPNQIDKSPYSSFWNSPVVYTDPDGNCPICPALIVLAKAFGVGFTIGAGADIATQVTVNKVQGKPAFDNFNTSSAVVSGFAGGLSGGASSIASTPVRVGVSLTIATGEAVAKQVVTDDAVNDAFNGNWQTMLNNKDNLDATQVVSDVLMDQLGNTVKSVKTADVKVLERQADRASRVSNNDPASTGRAAAKQKAQSNLNSANNQNNAVGTYSGNLLQETSNALRANSNGTNDFSFPTLVPATPARESTNVNVVVLPINRQ